MSGFLTPFEPGMPSRLPGHDDEPGPVTEYTPGMPTDLAGHPGEAIARVEARQVRRLTGEFASDFWHSTVAMGNVVGTDLGHMFNVGGTLHVVFGDSYGAGSTLPPEPQVPPHELKDWRSNTMAVVEDPSEFPVAGFNGAWMIGDADGHAKALLPRTEQTPDGRPEATKIPTNGIGIGERMFLHFMSVNQWTEPGKWVTNYSRIAYSDNGGWDWIYTDVWWPGNSNFAQVAFVRDGDYVYLFGIPAGRQGGVKLARVPADDRALMDPTAYRYYRAGADAQWVTREADATTIVPGRVGELSVMFDEYLNRWIMLYLKEDFPPEPSIVVCEARALTGSWSAPKLVCTGGYGPYMHPFLVRDRGEIVHFTMSRWRALPGDDHHYNVYIMEARFTKS